MVATCANSHCNRKFQELSKGRLFLLPPTDSGESLWQVRRLIDHCYWLCPDCAQTHTMVLQDGKRPVVTEIQPALARLARAA